MPIRPSHLGNWCRRLSPPPLCISPSKSSISLLTALLSSVVNRNDPLPGPVGEEANFVVEDVPLSDWGSSHLITAPVHPWTKVDREVTSPSPEWTSPGVSDGSNASIRVYSGWIPPRSAVNQGFVLTHAGDEYSLSGTEGGLHEIDDTHGKSRLSTDLLPSDKSMWSSLCEIPLSTSYSLATDLRALRQRPYPVMQRSN